MYDKGEILQKISDTNSISSDGTTYTKMGSTTVGFNGTVFTQMGNLSTDGTTRMGSTVTGFGTVFNKPKKAWGSAPLNQEKTRTTFKVLGLYAD